MGSKFCNLNIYGADPAVIVPLCLKCSVRAIAGGWITVVSEEFDFGLTQKEAKRLSQALPHPVLSTEYFDDDYVEFALYSGGKRVARHIPAEYEGFARAPGKSKIWAEQLGLSQEAEKALSTVFKETKPEVALRLIECVLNCPLWVDAEFIDSVSEPTQEYLTEYLERKKAEKKIKNQTKLVLLDEVEGDFGYHITCPAVKNEHTNAMKSFWDIRGGKLQKLFEERIPEEPLGYRAAARGENMFLLTFREVDAGRFGEVAYVFSDEGEELERICADEIPLFHGAFLDRKRVFLEGICWNIRAHEKEWDLGVEQTAYGIRPPCRLNSGRLAMVYDVKGSPLDGYLVSLESDGSGRNILTLPGYRHWPYPIAWQDRVLMACDSTLTCYDPSLNEIWSVDLGEDVGQLDSPFLDDKTNMLYMSTYRYITAFDLGKRKINAMRNVDGEDCFLYGILPGVGPVMMTGNSSLQVWDADLTPISRHRVKGMLGHVVHQDGKVYVLTNTSEESELRKTETGRDRVLTKLGCLRLYELKV